MKLRSALSFIVILAGSSPGFASTSTTTTAISPAIPLLEAVAPNLFPHQEALADQVAFWRNVYGYWSSSQVALHDMEYLGIIYEVIDLPGNTEAGYTPLQKKYIEAQREDLQRRLQALEQRYKTPEVLTDAERELLFRMRTSAGEAAVVGAADRVRSQRGLRERFRRGLEISGRYDASFRRIFKAAGLPQDLAFLPHVESSFQTSARSSVGALGVWQFTRGAARLFLKLNPAVDERLDPVASARGAARYLEHAYGSLGDWAFAITSYNHGVVGMQRAKKEVGDDFPQVVRSYQSRSFGFASRNFYTEFLAARDVAHQPTDFFAENLRYDPPLNEVSLLLDRKMSSIQLAKAHAVDLKELSELNPAWSRRAARGELHLPAGIEVWLPAKEQKSRNQIASVSAATAPTITTRSTAKEPILTISPAAGLATVSPVNTQAARKYHVVRRRDTLHAIAARYDLSITTLKTLNHIAADSALVRVGQKLLVVEQEHEVPRAAPVVVVSTAEEIADIIHIVRKGESPFEIATSYGVSVTKLLATNELNKRSVIYPGQRFRIPR